MEDFRTRSLSLHQIVARDASPAEIVRLAAELGCAHVCLFTQSPFSPSPFPVVEDGDVDELRLLMDALGVSILATTSFAMTPGLNVADYAPGLARTAALGGSIANVRVVDDDKTRAFDNFARFGELAAQYGITPTVEFTGYDIPHILDQTLDMIAQAGRGKLCLDPLHVMRTGVGMQPLLRLDRSLTGYAQLCDGPLTATREEYGQEGGYHRLPPGAGGFPLFDFLRATPEGAPLSLEVPQESLMQSGVSARERAQMCVDGARRLLEKAAGAA
jgi:sugar phosphate isomerase/epimerase